MKLKDNTLGVPSVQGQRHLPARINYSIEFDEREDNEENNFFCRAGDALARHESLLYKVNQNTTLVIKPFRAG